ncbi:MAG: cytidine(C)-cytidine(C)-adenosine (A)]-adding enzyme [Phycisphaerae bacterium]|nr:MAG: cytidine(C)-cytidine(C)-adenosine (A)]-adding enzyme [Phycisphaerae bacterium]
MTTPAAPTPDRHAAVAIVRILRDAGHVAYFAGGCVRDELLGVTPEDYDVATDATPDRVVTLFPKSGEVGKSFGVVIVKHGGPVVEVATFRADGLYTDRRRPDSVRFSTPAEDAARRDFTVNALFLDPLGAEGGVQSSLGGTVIDLVGGLKDLSTKILRAVGDPAKRLAEDHLRALRAARLAAKLGFVIEAGTAEAIRAHATDLRGVSRERVGEEVRRMVSHPTRARAAQFVRDLGLAGPVFMQTNELSGSRAGTPHLAALGPRASVGTYLAGWAMDLGEVVEGDAARAELCARWRRALCLSNDEHEAMRAVLRLVAGLRDDWRRLGVAGRKRLAAQPCFADALCLFGVEKPVMATEIAADVASLASTRSGLAPTPWVTGDDLVAMGKTPGPEFKRILDAVYDAQLEDRIVTPEEGRELARRLGVQSAE